MSEREHFVRDLASGQWTMSELCLHYGVTRTTGYKWRDRHDQEGFAGLTDRSRAPRSCPHKTPQDVVELILEDADAHSWGARKILARLRKRYPGREFPARSTVFDILERHGRVIKRCRRTRWMHAGVAPLVTTAPNQIWTADFKGQFRTRNGVYCYPLTIADHYSRYLLACHGQTSIATTLTKPVFAQLFRDAGLPDAIRTDNGAPFASKGIHGLTALSVWWMKLGIVHQRIEPASPQQNAAHERMHRTLKARTTRPPSSNLNTQQRAFNHFIHEYNHERPHEALDDETPASRWVPSSRFYPETIPPPQYPDHFEVRRVSTCGTFRIHSSQIFLSSPLANEFIGLEEVDDGLWNIVYYDTLLGRVDEESRQITGAPALK